MEPKPTTPGGVPPTSPTGAPSGPLGVPSADEARRAKWREKAKRAYERRKARLAGQPVPDAPTAPGLVGGTAGDPVAAPLGGPGVVVGPVPWTSDMVRPLFETILPQLEKLTVEQAVAAASKLKDDSLVAMVRKEAPWNPVAKATVLAQGPDETAALMNSLGVDATHGRAVILAGAIGSIFVQHRMLLSKLEQMAKRDVPSSPPPKPELPAP